MGRRVITYSNIKNIVTFCNFLTSFHCFGVNVVNVMLTVTEHCVRNSMSALPMLGPGMWGGCRAGYCKGGGRDLGGCG